jgi:peroxiredoxin (alkyl hydroperoxide reductase subunit C)
MTITLKKGFCLMLKIGEKAPHFKCQAVLKGNQVQNFDLEDAQGKYTVLFFYPLDFTFVCPTELHAFQEMLAVFEEKNAQIIGISVDSIHSHLAWLGMPKNQGGIQGVTYPLLSDITKSISRSYGVLKEEEGIALRGTFVLDKNNIVQHATINNLGLGRNVWEILRVITALQQHEKSGEVCPANWTEGLPAMSPTQKGLKQFFN